MNVSIKKQITTTTTKKGKMDSQSPRISEAILMVQVGPSNCELPRIARDFDKEVVDG